MIIERKQAHGYSNLSIGMPPSPIHLEEQDKQILTNAFILDAVDHYENEPKLMSLCKKAFNKVYKNGVFELPSYNANSQFLNPVNYITNSAQAEYFVRMLAWFYPNMLMTKYAPLFWRDMCPVIRGDSYSKTEITQMYDMVGQFSSVDELSGNYQMLDVSAREQSSTMIMFGLGIQWQYLELQADMEFNKIKPAKMFALNRTKEQLLNSMFYQGSAKNNITGVLTDSTLPRQPVPAVGTGGSTTWATKTPDQIVSDLRLILNNMISLSLGTQAPRKLEISLTQFQAIFADPRSDYVDTDVYQYIVTKYPTLESISGNPFLDGLGAGGTGVAILYDNSTPDNYHMNIPFEMLPMPVIYKGMEIDFPFFAKTTGLVVNYSNSINIWDGL